MEGEGDRVSESLTGHVIGGPADTDYDGGVLTADLAIGDTVLHVDDTADFDEDASLRDASLVLNVDFDAVGNQTDGTALAYTTCDDDAGTVTLAAVSPLAASTGDRVYLQDPVSGGLVGRVELLVSIDGGDSTGDPVPAYIDVALLEAAGDVDLNEMAVELDEDEDGQLYVSGFPGMVTRQGAVRFKALDSHTVTTLGDQTMALTYLPIPESEHLRWNSQSQDYDDFSRDARIVTIPDPDGVLELGDRLTMQYAYTYGVATPLLSIPLGTSWAYANGLGSSTTYAAPAFDDSAWASAPTPLEAPLYVSPGNVWQRISGVSTGGDLTFTMTNTDNQTKVYLDGALIYSASVWSLGPAVVTVPCAAGEHVFAVYSVDSDGPSGIGQGTGIEIEES